MHTTRSRGGRVAAALATFALSLAFLPLVTASAAAPKPLFEQIGSLERFPADSRAALGERLVPFPGREGNANQKFYGGTLLQVVQARQLWQFYNHPQDGQQTGVVVRDLDSLRIVGTLVLDGALKRASGNPSGGGDWAHAVDDKGTRLWLLQNLGQHLYEIDLRTFAVTKRLLPGSSTVLFPFTVGGMTYDRFLDDMLVLYGGPSATLAANANAFLYRMDVSVPAPATFPREELAKMYRFRACSGPVTSTDSGSDTSNWDILVTEPYLYVPCQRAGHTVIVVRTPRPDGNSPDHPEDVAAGPVYGSSVLADDGSGRLFVTTIRREIWAFETSTMSFVGVVATGPDETTSFTGFGLDTETGRFFFQSKHFGMGVAEGRFFPIPQARTMPKQVTGQERIWSDARTNRLFVLDGDTNAKATAYTIYRTDAAPTPPPPPDPDRNTADVAEKDGVTEARYNATGSGYGTRVVWARGIATVPPAPTLGVVAPTADQIKTLGWACGFTDRQLVAGRVAKAEYDTGSTAAQAVAADVDDATKQDLGKPSRCDMQKFQLGPALTQLDGKESWDYEAAACATSTNDELGVKSDGKGGDLDLGPSTVECPLPGQKLAARAESRVDGPIQVDRSFTETSIGRDVSGVTSKVTAVAQGVSINLSEFTDLPAIRIGEIRSTAVSSANGRPKRQNLSNHTVTISDVYVGDEAVCTGVCPTPQDLEERLNVLVFGRAVFRTGLGDNSGRDRTLLEGSPRGAQTAVQKSMARQASDRALVGDFTVEVPGLEMTVFNDNTSWGRARQVYQFAGVASSSTYNIVMRPTFGSFDDDSGLPEDVQVTDADGTPFTELVDNLPGTSETSFSTAPAAGRRDSDDQGGLVGVLKAVGRGLRLFLTSPRTALLLLTAWALLSSPAVLSRRRRLLAGVRG